MEIISKKPTAIYNFISFFASKMGRLKAYRNSNKLDKLLTKINNNPKCQTYLKHFKNCVFTSTLGLDAYIFNPSGKNSIVYLHGGAFINRPTKFHIKFVQKIARLTNCKVYMPMYPLAPKYNVTTCLKELKIFMEKLKEDVVLLGDSAGGGLVFSLQKYLQDTSDINNVIAVVGVSPWLDMRYEQSEQQCDKMLNKQVVDKIAQLWKGDLKLDNPYCSPACAKFSSLNALIIVGGKEALINDTYQLIQNNPKANISCFCYKNLDHDFALFPVPEADDATTKVGQFIINAIKGVKHEKSF